MIEKCSRRNSTAFKKNLVDVNKKLRKYKKNRSMPNTGIIGLIEFRNNKPKKENSFIAKIPLDYKSLNDIRKNSVENLLNDKDLYPTSSIDTSLSPSTEKAREKEDIIRLNKQGADTELVSAG
ncbi:MAG: hypothetical protein HRU20_26815 [Pseudomonadales bacterium]|nr:hypothetical protein [Pseudomonadales bacterium]